MPSEATAIKPGAIAQDRATPKAGFGLTAGAEPVMALPEPGF